MILLLGFMHAWQVLYQVNYIPSPVVTTNKAVAILPSSHGYSNVTKKKVTNLEGNYFYMPARTCFIWIISGRTDRIGEEGRIVASTVLLLGEDMSQPSWAIRWESHIDRSAR